MDFVEVKVLNWRFFRSHCGISPCSSEVIIQPSHGRGGGAGAYLVVACLCHSIIDHARRGGAKGGACSFIPCLSRSNTHPFHDGAQWRGKGGGACKLMSETTEITSKQCTA